MHNIRIAWLEVSDLKLLPAIEQALIDWFNPKLNKSRNSNDSKSSIKWRLAVLMADREVDYKQLANMTRMHHVTVSKHKNMRVMPERLERETFL